MQNLYICKLAQHNIIHLQTGGPRKYEIFITYPLLAGTGSFDCLFAAFLKKKTMLLIVVCTYTCKNTLATKLIFCSNLVRGRKYVLIFHFAFLNSFTA